MPANDVKESKRVLDKKKAVADLLPLSWLGLNSYEQLLKSVNYPGSIYAHIEKETLEAQNLMGISVDSYYDSLPLDQKSIILAKFFNSGNNSAVVENDAPPAYTNTPPAQSSSYVFSRPSAPPPSYDYQQFSRLSVTPEKAAELLSNAFNYYNRELMIGIRLNLFRALRDKTFSEALTLFEANLSLNTFQPIVELYLQASAPGCWSSLFGSSEPPRLLQAITPPLCEIFGTSKDHLRFHASRWVETQSSAAVNPSYA